MFGKVIKDSNFDIALRSINTTQGHSAQFVRSADQIFSKGKLLVVDGDSYLCNLNVISSLNNYLGFDESILEYSTLEGDFKVVSYAVVANIDNEYTPAIFLDLSFYSRFCPADELADVYINSDDQYAFDKHYNKQKIFFIDSLNVSDAIFLMDGPLFSGINTQYNFRDSSNIYIHFVKNSSSNQICELLKINGFNNDLHWAMRTLKPFQRGPIFKFTSDDGRSKLFSYLKLSEKHSPVRVETASANFELFFDMKFWNTLCHQYVANGLGKNNQPRLIELSERYAREAINKSQIMSYLVRKNMIPTMNEMRF
jgi:hypothetical protein